MTENKANKVLDKRASRGYIPYVKSTIRIAAAAALLLSGCGAAGSITEPTPDGGGPSFSSGPWRVDGYGADQASADLLPGFWQRIEACVQKRAEVARVEVHLVREEGIEQGMPWFFCPLYPRSYGGVGGCSTTGGSVPEIWAISGYVDQSDRGESARHEMIHILLWKATGNPDTNHDGPWWVKDKKKKLPDGSLGPGLACQAR